MSPRSCPVCHGQIWAPLFSARELFDSGIFPLARCQSCGLVATVDDLTPEQLSGYYRYAGDPDAGHRFRKPLEVLMRTLRRQRLRTILKHRPEPGRILDVGCGRGVMLEALAARAWETWGLELDQEVAATARERLGERVLTGDFETTELPVSELDVISFWHVFEHLADPRRALAKARDLLTPAGVILIAVPNIDSWQAHWFGPSWLHLDVPRHRWHFTPEALVQLAAETGLVTCDIGHFSLEYGPYGMLQSALASLGLGQRLFTRVLRPGGGAPLWRETAFWTHLALAGPIAGAAALALPAEALAAAFGKGGVISIVLKRRA
jgi:2-polyprenyl-3-methyl-5-hydroxy-6-metoxy-1,4-benzoquinol methylase